MLYDRKQFYIFGGKRTLKCVIFQSRTEIISDDYVHSHNQVVDELNTKNNLLKNDVDELNKQIIEQAQQRTGTKRLLSGLY